MRVAVLGAGAMGSWFGGKLALQGHEVELLTTNEAHAAAVRENGLVMHEHSGSNERQAPVSIRLEAAAPEHFSGDAELIIVLTKSFQTQTAMASIADQLKDNTAVLTLQNGLGNADAIRKFVKPQNIWVGMSMMPVDRLAPGVVASRGTGKTRFGHLDGLHHLLGDQIAEAFSLTGMDVRHDPQVRQHIWQKVAFNAGMNALCALTHGTPGTVGQLSEGRDLARSVATEVAALAAAEGVPFSLEAVFETIAYACEHHGTHKASMLQDLLSGRRTEVDALNGAIVALGHRHDIATPLNATLATLVRMAELGNHSGNE